MKTFEAYIKGDPFFTPSSPADWYKWAREVITEPPFSFTLDPQETSATNYLAYPVEIAKRFAYKSFDPKIVSSDLNSDKFEAIVIRNKQNEIVKIGMQYPELRLITDSEHIILLNKPFSQRTFDLQPAAHNLKNRWVDEYISTMYLPLKYRYYIYNFYLSLQKNKMRKYIETAEFAKDLYKEAKMWYPKYDEILAQIRFDNGDDVQLKDYAHII